MALFDLVNPNRIADDIGRFSEIGHDSRGGVTRLAFTREERQAHDELKEQARRLGMESCQDGVGNFFARRDGLDGSLPSIMLGSHLDTVPQGGKLDGALGVIAALEAVRILVDQRVKTRHPIEIVSFAAEESARFGVGMLGSQLATGKIPSGRVLALRDSSGMSVERALHGLGYTPSEVVGVTRNIRAEVAAFLELHIEQGPVLESKGIPAGIVTDIAAATRLQVEVRGSRDHSGTTPMSLRRDALAGAAEMILAVESYVKRLGSRNAVGTVGVINVEPGAMNVIPGKATLGVDIRDADSESKRAIVRELGTRFQAIADARGLTVRITTLSNDEPQRLSSLVIETMRQTSERVGFAPHIMISGAGHDAMQLAPYTHAGMIFVPSRGGRSHCPDEDTAIDDIVPGVQLLLETVLALDERID